MAQITLDEEEYQKIKSENFSLKREIKDYEKRIEELKPGQLKKRLKDNAFVLANAYLKALFTKLGFKVSEGYYSDPLQMDRCSYIPDTWYLDTKSITVRLEANITNETKEAFFRMGVVTAEQKEEDPLEVKL